MYDGDLNELFDRTLEEMEKDLMMRVGEKLPSLFDKEKYGYMAAEPDDVLDIDKRTIQETDGRTGDTIVKKTMTVTPISLPEDQR